MIDWGAIKTNLASGAIIAILGSLAGFLLGTSQTNVIASDVVRLKEEVSTLKANDKTKREFLNCVQLALERLNNGIKAGAVCELKAE